MGESNRMSDTKMAEFHALAPSTQVEVYTLRHLHMYDHSTEEFEGKVLNNAEHKQSRGDVLYHLRQTLESMGYDTNDISTGMNLAIHGNF